MAVAWIGRGAKNREALERTRREVGQEAARVADARFGRLWTDMGRRAKEAGITEEDVRREVEAFRAGR